MKKKIVNAFLLTALLASSVGTFVSCKDYDEDSYVDLRSRITDLKSQIDALNSWKSTLKQCECDLKDYITKTEADGKYAPIALQTAVTNLQNAISTLEGSLDGYATEQDLASAVSTLNSGIIDAKNLAQSAYDLASSIKSCTCDLEPLKNSINDINGKIAVWNDQLKAVKDSASYALTLAKTDSALIVDLQNRLAELEAKDYHVWTIGTDGYWYDNGEKTEYKAVGENGTNADVWTIESDGYWYKNGEKSDYKAIGQDGTNGTNADVWTIGPDGYWYLNGERTDNKAIGQDGTPGQGGTAAEWTIGSDGYWYKDNVKTDYKAIGQDGTNGTNGTNGLNGKDADVWSIGTDGYWYKNDEKTEYYALGTKGDKGDTGDPANLEEITKSVLAAIDLSNYYTIKEVDSILTNTYYTNTQVDSLIKIVTDSLSKYETIEDFKNTINNLFKDDTYGFQTAVNDLMKQYTYDKAALDTQFDGITTKLNNIEATMKAMVTGIELQATDNPVLGYINAPLDTRSLMLMTYFGEASYFEFPTKDGGTWIDSDDQFTDREVKIMTNGATTLEGVEGYIEKSGSKFFATDRGDGKVVLGNVYMSINPTNVDNSGLTLQLKNSVGGTCGVELEPTVKSDRLLTFGYDRTRAEASGFYAAKAVMDINDDNLLNNRLALDYKAVGSKLKSAFKNRSTTDLLDVAVDVYQAIDNVLPAYGVKYTDSEGRTINSTYGIGVATIKPLSFNTLVSIDALYKGLPGRNRIYNIIDKIIQQIEVRSPVPTTSNWIEFDEVKSDGGNTLTVTYRIFVDGVYKTDTATVSLDSTEASDLRRILEVLAESSEGTAKILAELINELNKVDANWDDVFQEAKDNMVKYLMQYVDKAYKKANNYYHLYTLLDINMVAHKPGKGFRFVGQTKRRATKVNGEVTLYPITNTMEYFAPAYKKYVAISNVYNASTRAELPEAEAMSLAKAAAGENCNKVINGDMAVKISGQSGYIYEISYEAVDYHGMNVRSKYYVEF